MADPNHVHLAAEKLVIAMPAKNANTSIKLALAKVRGLPIEDAPAQEWIHKPDRPFSYVDLARVPASCDVVGVLRHPLRRIWSSWRYLHPQQALSDYVRFLCDHEDKQLNQHDRSQASDLMVGRRVVPQWWIYVETLVDDWRALCRWRNWTDRGITHENQTPGPPYQEHAFSVAQIADLMGRFRLDWALYHDGQAARLGSL